MVFLSSTEPVVAYGVVALFDPFEKVIGPYLPRMIETTLLPFKGRIVYDGELDALKDSVKRLHVTSPAPLPATFSVPGAVALKIHGNEALVSVRDATPQLVEDIRARYAATVGVQDLNLEDIFLELHHAPPQK